MKGAKGLKMFLTPYPTMDSVTMNVKFYLVPIRGLGSRVLHVGLTWDFLLLVTSINSHLLFYFFTNQQVCTSCLIFLF